MNPDTPLLLLVESNTTGTGRQFAARAALFGVEPVLLCADPGRYPYVAEDRIRTVVTDTADPAAVLTTARTLAAVQPVAGVLSSSEYYVATAAATAHALGLDGPDAAAVQACRDKGEQRARLAAAGVPQPRFAVLDDAAHAAPAAREIGLPVVVKPVMGSGSLGVRLCTDAEQVSSHAAQLLEARANERGLAAPARILVEEYLPGDEFSVELFDGHPVATVAKHVGPHPHFVETGHDTPAPLPAERHAALLACAREAAEALGLGWGALHVELRMTGTDARVIEVNPRLAGGMIPELIKLSHGVDLVGAQVEAALGRAPRPAPHPGRRASIRFLTAAHDGLLQEYTAALAAARAVPGVTDATVYRRPGEPVGPAADFRDRYGHVIAAGTTPADARNAAEHAQKLLQDVVRDPAVRDPGVRDPGVRDPAGRTGEQAGRPAGRPAGPGGREVPA
ncbi:ATP-grasp domain-containing protein [Streptomyces sp. NPDC051561]|uniref:ATP-grasp domain-containing protein n=1 Tax=Streptomyces sp. NPDC051561 TaxID=3365658 RepID=UPI00379C7D6F